MDRTEDTVVSPTISAPRIVDHGPVLTSEDVVDALVAVETTYASTDTVNGVAVVDGFGARVAVERGHLELHDGVGPHRRVRRFSKVDAPRRVVVGIGTSGVLSLDALRWCNRVGTSVVVLGGGGALLAAGPPGRDDARLVRAQALALFGPSGLEVVRYLIGEKIRGQANVLGLRLAEDDAASTLLDLLAEVESCESIDEIRQREAAAANVYWSCWERSVAVAFARKDLPRVPKHWLSFNGRRSSVNPTSPRSATDPAGALLNYGYRLAEIESTLACRRIGLSESLGVLHADMAGRPSFSCDVMEALRPVVDSHVLDLCAGPLRKREFVEGSRGVVRVLAPMSHRLAEAMPSYAVALGPVVEHVADLLAASSPYDVSVPSVLSGAKHREAAQRRVAGSSPEPSQPKKARGPSPVGLPSRNRRQPKPSASPPLLMGTCRGCGGPLPIERHHGYARPRTEWCSSCLSERREEVAGALPVASRLAAERFAEATGSLPTHTDDAQAARTEANRRQRVAEIVYEAHSDFADELGRYHEEIQPRLAGVSLVAIARACGVSTSAASKWRAGRRTPHPRHWNVLAQLVGVDSP